MTITEDATLTDADRRFGLRHLARVWDGLGCRDHADCAMVARIVREEALRYFTSPGLPAHDAARARHCDCLGCLWDEFRGALAALDGLIDETVSWQEIGPEYGERDDPEGECQIDLEAWVFGLLCDLTDGVTRRAAA